MHAKVARDQYAYSFNYQDHLYIKISYMKEEYFLKTT